MKMEREFRNDLMKRKEVSFSLEAESNPGFAKIVEHCKNHFKVDADRVVVKSLFGNFGSKRFFANAFIYDSLEDKNSIEPKIKVKKEALK